MEEKNTSYPFCMKGDGSAYCGNRICKPPCMVLDETEGKGAP